jgi:hypothetical protein
MKFEVGTRVALNPDRFNPDESIQCGTIITESVIDPLSKKEKVYIKWDDGWYNSHTPQEVLVEELVTEAEARAKEAEFEKEFSAIEGQVAVKLNEAVLALEEAARLAKTVKSTVRVMCWDGGLKEAVWEAGWTGSSMSC